MTASKFIFALVCTAWKHSFLLIEKCPKLNFFFNLTFFRLQFSFEDDKALNDEGFCLFITKKSKILQNKIDFRKKLNANFEIFSLTLLRPFFTFVTSVQHHLHVTLVTFFLIYYANDEAFFLWLISVILSYTTSSRKITFLNFSVPPNGQ